MYNNAEFDVVVIGGGPTGVCAAVSAARQGATVLLVEQNGFSGGMATAGLVGPFMTCYDKSGENMIIRGLFEEVVDRLVNKGGAIHPSQVRSGGEFTSWIVKGHDHCTPFDSEILKCVYDDMLTEAGVEVLYHTVFVDGIMEDKCCRGVLLHGKNGEMRITANAVIDCTGDGDVAVSCGAEYEFGSAELNLVQPATMFFRINNVNTERLIKEIEDNKDKFYSENGVNYRCLSWYIPQARAAGEWDINRVSVGLYRGVREDEWCINTSRIGGVDSTDPKSHTSGEIEGRRQVQQIMAFLHKYVPGCEDARLMSCASTLGIRESRHIKGDFYMTAEDVLQGRIPDDSVVLCSNSVDFHGRFGPNSSQYISVQNGEYYGVSYRSLLPTGIENLLVAGRCFSADSTAAAAVRVMPPCMAMGQAAGTAAAMAVKEKCTVRRIDTEALRKVLKRNGAFL